MSTYNQKEFAKLAGVSKQAIAKAIKNKKLKLNSKKKIDDKNALSMLYLRQQLEKSKNELTKETVKVKKKNIVDNKKPENKIIHSDNTNTFDKENQERFEVLISKDEIEAEYKKAQTEKVKIHNAEKLRELIPTEIIQKRLGKLSSVILNLFFPIGDRLSPLVCSECKITTPAVIKRVKKIIDNEVTRSLSEMKKAINEDLI